MSSCELRLFKPELFQRIWNQEAEANISKTVTVTCDFPFLSLIMIWDFAVNSSASASVITRIVLISVLKKNWSDSWVPNIKCGIIYFGYKLYLDCDLGWDDVRVKMLSGPAELGLRQKVTLWVAQRLYITAIWVKTGRVVKRLVCSVIGVDIRALDWLDLEGQIFHMSEGDYFGEPDYSLGFINQVIFCAPSVSNTCTHECAFDTWSNAHTLWRSAYWSIVLGAMFGTREGRVHIWI